MFTPGSIRGGRLLLAAAVALLALTGATSPAWGAYGIASFDGSVTADPSGNVSYTQAGGHPYAVSTTFSINTRNDPAHGDPWPDEPIKDVLVDVPPGLVGNPTVVPQCSLSDMFGHDSIGNPLNRCAPATQVGTASIDIIFGCFSGTCLSLPSVNAVYNLVPPPGVPARFGFQLVGSLITLDAKVGPGPDYRLAIDASNASAALPVLGTTVTLWGVPADPSHDVDRVCPVPGSPTGCSADVESKAFLRLPTSCAGPQTTTIHSDSWFHPGDFKTASFVSHQTPAEGGAPQGATGCDQVPFDPTFAAQPQSTASPGPSGWTFDVRIPQDDIGNPGTIAQSDLKQATVMLPKGVRVSPSAADGLAACTPAQIGLHSDADPSCPDASKIGTATIDTPVLDDPVTGSVYLAKPHDNPSGSLVAMYLVAKGPGVLLKLPGKVTLDKSTGQISTTFDDNPQLPFSHLHLEFFGGDRAALSNPPRCGTYTTKAVMTSWSGKTVATSDSFTTSRDGHGAPCPAPRFKPAFNAGTSGPDGQAPAGGSSSSFVLNLSRSDEDEELGAIRSVDWPDGLLANVGSVPPCAAADAAAGTCGEASRVGSVTTAAGVGPHPFAVEGRVYLGGPYKGAPFSLSIVVPAVAGPFDLGTIVVRAAIDVDPSTAKVKIQTDPLPTILEGIPLQVRWISVLVDRPGFVVNPTSCNAKRIGLTVASTAGTVAALSSRFKVDDCARLPLSPRMRISVGSKGHTAKGASTPLTTTLTMPKGQAGLKAVGVTLPVTLNARLDVVNNACTKAQFDAGHCEDARAGTAVAVTPLLKHALRGGAYFVKDPDKPAGSLPNLIVALRGQVAFNLLGTVKIPHGTLLATHFNSVPDVPIKRFTLSLVSGRNGPLGAAADLCTARAKRQLAKLSFRGQNGKLVTVEQRLKVKGCTSRARR